MILVCPVCTVTVVAGLGVSRALGVDDSVTSVWIGGFILSSSFWVNSWLARKENLRKYAKLVPIAVLMYILFLVPLYLSHIIGITKNVLWGVDKIMIGNFFGSLAFIFGYMLDKVIRKKMGRQLFDFQKVVFPVSMLLITSFIFYIITK